jgi:hypothetical protein
MSSSALLSLGLIEHGNGLGRLDEDNNDLGSSKQNSLTHLTRPPEYVKWNGVPSESRRFSILQTESTVAATINIVASTKCLPGQTRFPNPNTDASVVSSRGVPFGLRNRSGLKTSGSGYTSGSRVIALRTVGKYRRDSLNTSYQIFPINQAPSQTRISKFFEKLVRPYLAPFGMKSPSYTRSSVAACGTSVKNIICMLLT